MPWWGAVHACVRRGSACVRSVCAHEQGYWVSGVRRAAERGALRTVCILCILRPARQGMGGWGSTCSVPRCCHAPALTTCPLTLACVQALDPDPKKVEQMKRVSSTLYAQLKVRARACVRVCARN